MIEATESPDAAHRTSALNLLAGFLRDYKAYWLTPIALAVFLLGLMIFTPSGKVFRYFSF